MTTLTEPSRHTDRYGRYIVSETLAARRERYELIRGLRDSGMTLEDIGAQFDPPFTKQRVYSILRAGSPRNPGRPPASG
jgi:hypothetical protein